MRFRLLAGTLLSAALILPHGAMAAPRRAIPRQRLRPRRPQGARRPRCRHPGPARAAPPPAPKGRLEGAITPAFYRLDMTVDPAKERFFGHVEIDALLHGSSRYVYLHGRDLNVTKASVNVNGRKFAAHWKQVDDTGVALLSFDEEIPAGQATFAFDYDAAFQDGPQGMFRVKVGDQWYSWTQFESIDARAAFPSFDQPGYKQPFTVTLRTPKGMMAVSNAPEVETTDDGAMTVHRFEQTAPLPTYLVAMMVAILPLPRARCPPRRSAKAAAAAYYLDPAEQGQALLRAGKFQKHHCPSGKLFRPAFPIRNWTRSPRPSCPAQWKMPGRICIRTIC
jgi:aminopeptidase N